MERAWILDGYDIILTLVSRPVPTITVCLKPPPLIFVYVCFTTKAWVETNSIMQALPIMKSNLNWYSMYLLFA